MNLVENKCKKTLSVFIVYIIFFLLPLNTLVYGKDLPFVSNKDGKVYTSHKPEKKIEPLFSELIKKHPGRKWDVEVSRGYAKRIRILPGLATGALTEKEFSTEFLSNFSQLFGVAREEVSFSSETKLKTEKVITNFQHLNNIPILNSHVTTVFDNAGLNYISSRVYPDVGDYITDTVPGITADKACNLSLKDAKKMREQYLSLECGKGELLIVTKEYASFIKKPKEYYLVWNVTVDAKKALFSYIYYIDAFTGELVNKYSNVWSSY